MKTFDQAEYGRMNYGIVLNDIPSLSNRTIDLGDWTLRRASIDEINLFREELIKYTISNYYNQLPFQETIIRQQGAGKQLSYLKESKDWRYLLVEPNHKDFLLGEKLNQAFRISDFDIWVELWNVNISENRQLVPRLGGSPLHCARFLTEGEEIVISEECDVDRLVNIIQLRKNLDEIKFPAITKALEMFRNNDTNREGPLKDLSYFAIIESLLSHAPSKTDSLDSISKQLKRNLILLNNRMDDHFNLGLVKFNTAKAETIITRLYSYRSAIAHGGNTDTDMQWFFDNKEGLDEEGRFTHKQQFISWYLRKIVQRVLVQALKEPQLVTDLK